MRSALVAGAGWECSACDDRARVPRAAARGAIQKEFSAPSYALTNLSLLWIFGVSVQETKGIIPTPIFSEGAGREY